METADLEPVTTPVFANEFITNYVRQNNLTIIECDENRPWGGYYIYETGPNYDKKIFFIKPGQYLSLQFHGTPEQPGHNEEWTAITEIKVVLGNKSVVGISNEEFQEELQNLNILKIAPGEKVRIPAGYLHALVNPYEHNIHFAETRMSQQDEPSGERESNITRVYDQSGRDGCPKWPEDLTHKIRQI
jgi:mannose-6-phosphate isomerase-like protein (cupin superfamily)